MSVEGVSAGRLVVCPTPIGNLGDLTLRGLEALRDADVIACEDTRRTGLLLERHGLAGAGRLVSYHEHNERRRSGELVARMRRGESVALVSDAGTPSISDPGLLLVKAALAEGLPVDVLPGASAVLVALVLSGLPAERFTFVGFLPRARARRRELFEQTADTLVAFESPRRLAATLELLAELDPRRRLAVCRELTKLHEEVLRGGASALAAHYLAHPPRGEIVLVVAGAPPAEDAELAPAERALRKLVHSGAKPRQAAKALSELTGIPANRLYAALEEPQADA
jgi:16S rRNA (cytidine1402-2'-O)-methyltransferase